MNITKYAFTPYVDGGRTLAGADCYGLVRLVLEAEFGIIGLPEFGLVCKQNAEAMNGAFAAGRRLFQPIDFPTVGAVACCFDPAGNMVHVGVVVNDGGGLCVLHTSSRHGVMCHSMRDFRRQCKKVEFWKYAAN